VSSLFIVCLLMCVDRVDSVAYENHIIGLLQVLWLEVQTSVRWLISRSQWGRPALKVLWWLWTGALKSQDNTNTVVFFVFIIPCLTFGLFVLCARIFTGSTRLDGNAIGRVSLFCFLF